MYSLLYSYTYISGSYRTHVQERDIGVNLEICFGRTFMVKKKDFGT